MKKLVVFIAITAFFTLAVARAIDHNNARFDCGPEGKPALNGTACIDREPVIIMR